MVSSRLEQPSKIGPGAKAMDQSPLRETSRYIHLMVVDMLTLIGPARNYNRSMAGLQGSHYCADTGMANDAVGFGHRLNHVVEGHVLDPRRIWHLRSWHGAAVLYDERLAVQGQGLD